MQISGKAARLGVLAAAALAASAPAAMADTLAGSAKNQRLVVFDSATPQDVTVFKLDGLAPAEEIVGLDQRGNGQLYALTDASRLYRIDVTAATATPVGSGPFSPLLAGSAFGFDFN